MSIVLNAGVEVEVAPPPLPAVTSTNPAEATVVDAPSAGITLQAPSVAPTVVQAPSSDGLVVPVGGPAGPSGGEGPSGPPGPPGPVGSLDEDLPDLTLLFENGLI